MTARSHCVYILECADKSYYVGSTNDLPGRLDYHLSGRGGAYTAKRQPVKLVFHEEHPTAESARERERQIKRWSHAKKSALIAGDLPSLKRLSRSRHRK